METRPVTPADAPVLACHAYPDPTDAAEREPFARWVQGAIAAGLYLGFVVQDGEEVVAGAGLLLLEWGPTRGDPSPYRGRVKNVWTHPGYRRRGLARALVGRCLEAACERGLARVIRNALISVAFGKAPKATPNRASRIFCSSFHSG